MSFPSLTHTIRYFSTITPCSPGFQNQGRSLYALPSFFLFFCTSDLRNLLSEHLKKIHRLELYIWRYACNVKPGNRRDDLVTSGVIRVVCSVHEGLIYLLMSRRERHGYEKLVSFGLKPMLYHILKRLSTERDDENSHDTGQCVCHSVSHLKYKHCRACRILWPFMLAVLPTIFFTTAPKDTGKLKALL